MTANYDELIRQEEKVRANQMDAVLDLLFDDPWFAMGSHNEKLFRTAASFQEERELGRILQIAINNCVRQLALEQADICPVDKEIIARDHWFRTHDLKRDIKKDSPD